MKFFLFLPLLVQFASRSESYLLNGTHFIAFSSLVIHSWMSAELVDCICVQAIESDMDVMIKYFDEVNDLGVKVAQHASGNEAAVVTVNSHLQACQERWDNIVQQMELSSKQVSSFAPIYLRKRLLSYL